MLIASWDTGVRSNELLRLTWNDIDFNAERYGTITVRAQNSKTERRRVIGMTPRLREGEIFMKGFGCVRHLVCGWQFLPDSGWFKANLCSRG
jgi:hypothetical protein